MKSEVAQLPDEVITKLAELKYLCANCGMLVPKTLADRVHDCPYCGFKADRDIASAIYIKHIGLNNLAGQASHALTPALVGVA